MTRVPSTGNKSFSKENHRSSVLQGESIGIQFRFSNVFITRPARLLPKVPKHVNFCRSLQNSFFSKFLSPTSLKHKFTIPLNNILISYYSIAPPKSLLFFNFFANVPKNAQGHKKDRYDFSTIKFVFKRKNLFKKIFLKIKFFQNWSLLVFPLDKT